MLVIEREDLDEDTVMIITMDTPPFDVLYGDD